MSGNIDPTATDTSKHDMGSHNSGVIHDFTCSATDVGSPAMSSTGSDTHRSRIIHAGPHGSKMANKLDRRMDSDLGKINSTLSLLTWRTAQKIDSI